MAEDFLEPLFKRCRLDVCMTGPEDWHAQDQASFASAAAAVAADLDRRRCLQMDDLQEPAMKRLRGLSAASDAAASSVGAAASQEAQASGNGGREASIRVWTEALVRTLQGCPSVEEAMHRCSGALLEFEAEVRQTALREADAAAAEEDRPQECSPQNLQHTNRVLMRAVHHLAERCRRLEAGTAETPALRQALEQSQEAQRRLSHSNQVLQEHLKVHLNGCHAA